MLKIFYFLLFIPFSLIATPPKVIVSVAPTKYLVERIAQSHVIVQKFVPGGASPHSYEPTSRQLLDAAKGKVWFRIGEGFEGRALTAIKGTMEVVNLSDELDLISTSHCCSHHHYDYDPHIWLSPRLLTIQANRIANTLTALLPEHTTTFQKNLASLLHDIERTDATIRSLAAGAKTRTLLVTHAAFGYFCREYGFEQLPIEIEGKEPSPKQMTTLLLKAKECHLDRVFVQPQHNTKSGLRIASELNAKVVWVDPYKENVLENLTALAHVFCDQD